MSEGEHYPNATPANAAASHGHVPVLYSEILTFLEPHAGGRYLDGTLGAGGHAHGMLDASSPDGLLLGLDRDAEAVRRASQRLAPFGERAILRHASFRAVKDILTALGWEGLDGAVLDLGLSSLQLAEADRGFSFLVDGDLDMRFDRAGQAETAEDLVNHLTEQELARLLWEFGEERNSRVIARAVVRARPVRSTRELAEIVAAASRHASAAGPSRIHPATRTFQALRIAVNDELGELKAGLPEVVDALKVGGKVAVISFHSLEDRIVKRTLRGLAGRAAHTGIPWPAALPTQAVLRDLTPKPIGPTPGEIAANPRARSARLRVAQRVAATVEGARLSGGARVGA